MAADLANPVNVFLQLGIEHEQVLARIRHWQNLSVARQTEHLWVKNFTEQQLNDPLLRMIPFARLYHLHGDRLFPFGSRLPAFRLPTMLWTPIARVISVERPNYNHHFFGFPDRYSMRLIKSEFEETANVMLINIQEAHDYIVSAPANRLNGLQWLIVNEQEALIWGTPLLSLNAPTYWTSDGIVMPIGYTCEFSILEKVFKTKCGVSDNDIIWWKDENTYCLIDTQCLVPLSIASWRQTFLNPMNK